MMFGPEGDDDSAEVQFFAAVAVTVGLVWARKISGEDEARAIRLISYSFCKSLSDQWHRPFDDAAALYQERYAEYALLVAANFHKPSFARINALDRHVMGEAAKDRERQKHLSNLVIVASGC
jgi:hypothetical protein